MAAPLQSPPRPHLTQRSTTSQPRTQPPWREHLDRVVLVDDLIEDPHRLTLLPDLLGHPFPVLPQHIHEQRGTGTLVDHARQHRFDLPAGETSREQALDEDHAVDRLGREASMAGVGALGLEQSLLLVIADGSGAYAARFGHLPYRKQLATRDLDIGVIWCHVLDDSGAPARLHGSTTPPVICSTLTAPALNFTLASTFMLVS